MFSNCLLNIYIYSLRLELFPTLAREGSFHSGQQLMNRLLTGQVLELCVHSVLSLNVTFLSSPQRLGELAEMQQKECESQRWGGLLSSTNSQTGFGCCTHELGAAMLTYTKANIPVGSTNWTQCGWRTWRCEEGVLRSLAVGMIKLNCIHVGNCQNINER